MGARIFACAVLLCWCAVVAAVDVSVTVVPQTMSVVPGQTVDISVRVSANVPFSQSANITLLEHITGSLLSGGVNVSRGVVDQRAWQIATTVELLNDDFEGGSEGDWTHGKLVGAGGITDQWIVSAKPACTSGTCFWSGDIQSGTGETFLNTPAFPINGDLAVSFVSNWQLSTSFNQVDWVQGVLFQLECDGSGTYNQIEPTGGYPSIAGVLNTIQGPNCGNAYAGSTALIANRGEYTPPITGALSFNLTSAASSCTSTAKVRFLQATDCVGQTGSGFYLDNVLLTSSTPLSSATATFSYTVPPTAPVGSSISLTYNVTGVDGETVPSNNAATVTLNVANVNVGVGLVANVSSPVDPTTAVGMTATVTNTGDRNVTAFSVTMQPSGRVVAFPGPYLAPGSVYVVTDATVVPSGVTDPAIGGTTLNLQATLSVDAGSNFDTGDDTAVLALTVSTLDLFSSATANVSTVSTGDVVGVRVVVSNRGTGVVPSWTMTDNIESQADGMLRVMQVQSTGTTTYDAGNGVFSSTAPIPPSGSVVVEYTMAGSSLRSDGTNGAGSRFTVQFDAAAPAWFGDDAFVTDNRATVTMEVTSTGAQVQASPSVESASGGSFITVFMLIYAALLLLLTAVLFAARLLCY